MFRLYHSHKNRIPSRFFFFFSFFSSFSLLKGAGRYGAMQDRDLALGKEVMRMDRLQIPNFQQFCEQEFQLRQQLGPMEDRRQAPPISAGTVAEAV
jgi:hypothetical protein